MMVSVTWLCVFIILVANSSTIYGRDTDLRTEESFITHATEISNILHTLISLVRVAAENEGKLLDLPETPLSLDFDSATLEELFDKFERSCQSFRTKFLKFVKKELESIDPVQELVFTTSDPLSTSEYAAEYAVESESNSSEFPEHIVAVVGLDSVSEKSADDVEDNYLESESNEVNSYEDSSTLYTLDEATGQYETDSESLGNTEETLSEESESLVEYDTAPENPTIDAASKNQDSVEETSYEATTKQALEQFLEEISSFEEEKLKDVLSNSEGFLDRSGLLARERPMNFRITSVPGVRGKDFPDYEYIPQTSFTCEDKEYIPGFYADMDADCQVFHVCWPDRIESFLCPSGTQFNQQIVSCDYWFNLTCSQAPDYYSVNADLPRVQEAEHFVTDSVDLDESYQTLSILGYTMKIMPIQFSTTHPKDKSETSEPEPTTEDIETSLPVTEDLVHKMYEELYNADMKNLEDNFENDPEQLSVNLHQKKQRSNAKFFRTKLDRSGPVYETSPESDEIFVEIPVPIEVSSEIVVDTSEEPEILVQTPASEESVSADTEKQVFKKGVKKIYVDKNVIPVILNRLFDTADDVINKQILPFTREVLAASYGKLNKVKKH